MIGFDSESRKWIGMTAALCCLLTAGCEVLAYAGYKTAQRPFQRVPANSELWGGYEKGAVYELEQPVFLADYTNFAWGKALVSGEGMTREKKRGEWDGPATVEAYTVDPEAWPSVWGVVDAGTRVRCTNLREKKAFSYELTYLAVYARILDGRYKGKTVEITELSTYDEQGSWVARPDSFLLRRVDSSEGIPDRRKQQ